MRKSAILLIAFGYTLLVGVGCTDVGPGTVSPRFSVTYKANGSDSGSVPTDSDSYLQGDSATILGNSEHLALSGYAFGGWNSQPDGKGQSYAAGDAVVMGSADLTLYAVWIEASYSVLYETNGSDSGSAPADPAKYYKGASVTVLGNPGRLAREDFTFVGWNTQADGRGDSYSGGASLVMGDADLTLYARWSSAPVFQVVYEGNDASGGAPPADDNAYLEGDKVTVLGNPEGLERTGYSLDGWQTEYDGSGTEYRAGDTFTMGSAGLPLYPVWKAVHTVTYDANRATSGDAPTDSSVYYYLSTVTVIGNPGRLARIGYSFAGWNSAEDGSGTGYAGGDQLRMGTEDLRLYAAWTPIPYSVSYDANGASSGDAPTDPSVYHILSTVRVLGNTGSLAKTGYTFAGWHGEIEGYIEKDLAPGETFPMPPISVVLSARWTPIPYSVIYNANGATSGEAPTDPATYYYQSTATALGNTGGLARTGCTFSGWNSQADGKGTTYAAGTGTIALGAASPTLYAKWTAIPYTVTYDPNGAAGEAPTDPGTYYYQSEVTVLGNVTGLARSGYRFEGWTVDGSGAPYAAGDKLAMGAANLVLKAQWFRLSEVPIYAFIGGPAPYELSFTWTPATVGLQAGTVSLSARNSSGTPTAWAWYIDPGITLVGANTADVSFEAADLSRPGAHFTITLMEYIGGHWYSADFGFTAVNGSAVQ